MGNKNGRTSGKFFTADDRHFPGIADVDLGDGTRCTIFTRRENIEANEDGLTVVDDAMVISIEFQNPPAPYKNVRIPKRVLDQARAHAKRMKRGPK